MKKNFSAPLLSRVLISSCVFFVSGCSGKNIHRELKENKSILVRQWTNSTREFTSDGDRGSEYSNPILHENTLIFGTRGVGVTSIYPISNLKRWEIKIPDGVLSELTVEKGMLYFGGADGFLYAADVETGKIQWKYELRNALVSKPTISQGRIFVTTSDDTVYALDAGTGKWLWHYRRRSAGNTVTLNASRPHVEEREVWVGLSDGYLIGLSIDDGQLKWEKKIHQGSKFTDVDASPIVENGLIYIASYDGGLYCLKKENREVVWRFDSGGSKDVLIEGENLYLPASDGTLYALSKRTGQLIWKFDLDKGTPTQLVAASDSNGEYLIFGSSFQYLYLVDKKTGKGVYRFNVGHGTGFAGSPVYDSDKKRLYFLSMGGNLYSFSLRSKTRDRPHGKTDGYFD